MNTNLSLSTETRDKSIVICLDPYPNFHFDFDPDLFLYIIYKIAYNTSGQLFFFGNNLNQINMTTSKPYNLLIILSNTIWCSKVTKSDYDPQLNRILSLYKYMHKSVYTDRQTDRQTDTHTHIYICLTSVTRAKCGICSTLCWKIPNISGSIELFAL